MKGLTLDHENRFVHSGRSIVDHVVAAPPENEDNVTLYCVDATHASLFASVVQSAVPPLGKFVMRLESKCPENEDSVTPPCVVATMPVYWQALSNPPCHH